ncbi:MAG: GNAT family N-acetyltransferase [Acholeplasmataceae bacterium]|nr:GNAT family N-acetyltransferase [Acholeplasmataceae bacterium]
MIKIEPLQNHHLESLLALFNEETKQTSFLYKPLTLETFKDKFFPHQADNYDVLSFIILDDQLPLGFISGVTYPSRQKAYLTMVVVAASSRRQKLGTQLFHHFQDSVQKIEPSVKTIDIVFFNPIQFEWLIPDTNNHDHPNTPGVDTENQALPFFESLGFTVFAKQNSYYHSILNYTYSEDIQKRMANLKQEGIGFSLYDEHVHHGFNTFFQELNNDVWEKDLLLAATRKQPILIAHHNQKVIGFAGPLAVQPSLRGYFNGIGVSNEYRGKGVGKVLFSSLCFHLSQLGAHYMSLFTGETNPARKIYENEGFQIVRSWNNLRKEY